MKPNHRWSGWPGAFCLKCGAEHMLELAIANNEYDAYEGKWTSKESEQKYKEKDCIEEEVTE